MVDKCQGLAGLFRVCLFTATMAAAVAACGGPANAANPSPDAQPAPLPEATEAGRKVTFKMLRVTWELETKTLQFIFDTGDPWPDPQPGVEPKDPPRMFLTIVVSDPKEELTTDNVSKAALLLSGVAEFNSLYLVKDVRSSLKSLSGRVGTGKQVELEFDWAEGTKSAKAKVAKKIS